MAIKSGAEARLLGKLGATRRWANSTPEQRAEASRHMRQAMHDKYVERARGIAAAKGYEPTRAQLDRAAKLLHEADLAERRYKAWMTAHGRRKAASKREAVVTRRLASRQSRPRVWRHFARCRLASQKARS